MIIKCYSVSFMIKWEQYFITKGSCILYFIVIIKKHFTFFFKTILYTETFLTSNHHLSNLIEFIFIKLYEDGSCTCSSHLISSTLQAASLSHT